MHLEDTMTFGYRPARCARIREEQRNHRRRDVAHRDAVLSHGGDDGARLERRQDHVGAADPRYGEHGVRVDEVEHGRAVEPDVVRVEAVLGHAAQRVQDHVPLGQHDALRAARCAGRVVHLRARVVGRRDRVAGPRRWGAAAGREGLVGRSVLVPRRARPDDDADAADGARARHGFGEAARRDEDLAGGVCEAVCELVGG